MGTKQEHFFLQHVQDLYHRTIYNDYPSFTEFLTTGEMSALLQNQKMFPSVVLRMWGGHKDCDSKMAGFFPADFVDAYDQAFPICCIRISPVCGYFNTQRLFGGCIESWNFPFHDRRYPYL